MINRTFNNHTNIVTNKDCLYWHDLNVMLFFTWTLFNALDLITTLLLNNYGFMEMNPFIHKLLLEGFYNVLWFKVVVVTCFIVVVYLVYLKALRKHLIQDKIILFVTSFLLIINIGYFIVVLNNLIYLVL